MLLIIKIKSKNLRKFLTIWAETVKTLRDLKKEFEIVENGNSFAENALIKARTLAEVTKQPCLGEDSGLCLVSFHNWPGIYTKRAKGNLTNKQFNQLILDAMKEKKNRKCTFVSALAYVDPQKRVEKIFVSSIKGIISQKLIGKNDFGFDPIFYFPQLKKTYAQLTSQECEKNKISPRIQCLRKFLHWYKILSIDGT
ncbi:non-canonical purine NTP pyrophosphatase [endosymbiont GvMRE of Glomus versiforme]|uniref:non-canonical purine NTP pyrophosphatase n=1 Tax=endosymbiont GvMRE of Glomus versiforme TaxID=2039283 RepID=UPI0011C3C0AE|nr:non-canonical purine NTP pyrophosphatase [endosymbiont GvMRE of Glomus versiforme]